MAGFLLEKQFLGVHLFAFAMKRHMRIKRNPVAIWNAIAAGLSRSETYSASVGISRYPVGTPVLNTAASIGWSTETCIRWLSS